MKIYKAIRNTFLFQGFGRKNTYPSVLAMYESLNMKGHNGYDFVARDGDNIYWDCDLEGKVIAITTDLNSGYGIDILTNDTHDIYKHRFWHLRTDGIKVKAGQVVGTGDLIGLADNTGKYTTGTHLHRDLKKCIYKENGVLETQDPNNGYLGCVDISPFFVNMFVGDVMDNLNAQVGILKKIIELLKLLTKWQTK